MQPLLSPFIEVIRKLQNDPDFTVKLQDDWGSNTENHRVKIRKHLAEVDSSYFTREQQIALYNLLQRPEAKMGFVSISHCQATGGFSYSRFAHGFDVEEIRRISSPVITRTSTEDERNRAPHVKMLWVAKEAAFKALALQDLRITDLFCDSWEKMEPLDAWSYRIASHKRVPIEKNIGYVFSTPTLLIAVYFR